MNVFLFYFSNPRFLRNVRCVFFNSTSFSTPDSKRPPSIPPVAVPSFGGRRAGPRRRPSHPTARRHYRLGAAQRDPKVDPPRQQAPQREVHNSSGLLIPPGPQKPIINPPYKGPPWIIGGTLFWILGGGILFGQ